MTYKQKLGAQMGVIENPDCRPNRESLSNSISAVWMPWISVKDKLPSEDVFHVLLRVDREDEQSTWDIGLYEHVDGRWIHRLSQRYKCTVTHWMPLPAPPENAASESTPPEHRWVRSQDDVLDVLGVDEQRPKPPKRSRYAAYSPAR